VDRFIRFCRARGKTFKQRSLKTFSVVCLRNVLLQIFQRATHTVLGVYLKRTCSRVTSASSALGVLNDHDGVREGHYRVSRGTLPLFLYSFHWLPWTLYVLTVCVCGTVTDVETNPLTHSLVSVGAPAQHIGTTTASMRFFFIFRGRCAHLPLCQNPFTFIA